MKKWKTEIVGSGKKWGWKIWRVREHIGPCSHLSVAGSNHRSKGHAVYTRDGWLSLLGISRDDVAGLEDGDE